MKIFNWNWINLKLHPSCTNYSQVPQEKDIVLDHGGDEGELMRTEKKAAMAIGETEKETKALLLHDMLNGVLTIGTLGHRHPLLLPSIAYTSSALDQEEMPEEEEGQAKKDEKEEEEDDDVVPPPPPPSMEAASEEQKEAVIMAAAATAAEAAAANDQRSSCVISAAGRFKSSVQLNEETSKTELMLVAAAESPEIEKSILELPLLAHQGYYKKANQARTTTLSDLFAADPSNSKTAYKGTIDLGGNWNCSNNQDQSIAHPKIKKLEMQSSKNKRDINVEKSTLTNSKSTSKKFQKLITRMLKKKIHPEMAAATATAKEAAAKPSRSSAAAAAGPEASHGLDRM